MKLKVLMLFFLSIMGGFGLHGEPTLYLVADYDFTRLNLISQIQNLLISENNKSGKKYFSDVKILSEDDTVFPETNNYYVFLYGWKVGRKKSTIFFRTDGYFRHYTMDKIDKKKNPSLLIFVPVDKEAVYKLIKLKYIESNYDPEDIEKGYGKPELKHVKIDKIVNPQEATMPYIVKGAVYNSDDEALLPAPGDISTMIFNWVKTEEEKKKKEEEENLKKEKEAQKQEVKVEIKDGEAVNRLASGLKAIA